MRPRSAPLLVLVAFSAALAPAAPPDVASPLIAQPIASPDPVLGADGRVHLAYELLLVNLTPSPVTIDGVAALNPVLDGTAVETLQGQALADVLRLTAGGTGTTLDPGAAATLFMDAILPPDTAFPPTLEHRFSLTYQPKRQPPPAGDHDPAPPLPEKITFVGVPVRVGQRAAVVVAPPLRGGRWLVANGCCATVTAHRGATLPINGSIYVAERFAIDFVRLDAEGRLFTGDKKQLSSYAYFGVEIHSVADGVVVATEDGLPEQVPGSLPAAVTLQNAGGNHVVVDIGDGRFAFYAHMQPGSLRVKPGDRVTRGQVLGLLGNSGNTDAPHLHFHVMDGPAPLRANGRPYAFTSFVGNGVVTSEAPLWDGAAAPIDAGALAGDHTNQLPLNDQLITFPE
jgi:peptidase M23-like protein